MMVLLTVAASILTIIAYYLYYTDLKKAVISPNHFSWIVWSLSVSLETITYNMVSGDLIKTLCFSVSSLACIIITVKIWTVSIWVKPTRIEKLTVLFCVLSLIAWAFSTSAWMAHLLLLLALPVAFIPTIKSVHGNYTNENSKAWLLWSIADLLVLSIVIIRYRSYVELPYAIMEFICHSGIFLLIFYKRMKSAGNYFIKNNYVENAAYFGKKYRPGVYLLKYESKIYTGKKNIPQIPDVRENYFKQIDFCSIPVPSAKSDFINHSSYSNAGMAFTKYGVLLKAIKNISKNIEITWSYSSTGLKK